MYDAHSKMFQTDYIFHSMVINVSIHMKIFLHFRQDGDNIFLRKTVLTYQIIR
jgi:heme/copper-type cytochrome/quinol oxidase subunit 4